MKYLTIFDWGRVDWGRQDVAIAADLGCSRERVRQKRKALDKPQSLDHKRHREFARLTEEEKKIRHKAILAYRRAWRAKKAQDAAFRKRIAATARARHHKRMRIDPEYRERLKVAQRLYRRDRYQSDLEFRARVLATNARSVARKTA